MNGILADGGELPLIATARQLLLSPRAADAHKPGAPGVDKTSPQYAQLKTWADRVSSHGLLLGLATPPDTVDSRPRGVATCSGSVCIRHAMHATL